jgi:peroxiredoxin
VGGSETGGRPDPSDGNTKFERVVGAVVLLCVVILALQFGLWAYRRFVPSTTGPELSRHAFDVGVELPPVELTDLEGTPLELLPTKADPPATVLIILTTTCPYCMANVPIWNAIHDALGDQVNFAGLCLDDHDAARHFVERTRAEFPLLVVDDPRTFVADLGIHGVPQTLALDSNGVVQKIWGGGLTEDHVASILHDLQDLVPGLELAPLLETTPSQQR